MFCRTLCTVLYKKIFLKEGEVWRNISNIITVTLVTHWYVCGLLSQFYRLIAYMLITIFSLSTPQESFLNETDFFENQPLSVELNCRIDICTVF